MEFSHRIANLPGSPTVALNTKAKKLAAAGKKIYNFTVGEPDLPTPKVVIDKAIHSLLEGHTKYGPPGGSQALRSAIAEKLKEENGLVYDPEQIVCGVGAKEIIFHLCLALLNEGDEVVLPAPYWVSYPAQVEAAGAKVVTVPFDCDKMKIDFKALRSAVTQNTKLFIFNTPNNPAGYVLSESELAELGDILEKSNCWILSDEIYEYLSFDRPHQSLLTMRPNLKDRFILVNGMSKGFAMTGWRVGYCAAPASVAKLVRVLQSQSSTCLPAFIEEASVAALNNRSEIKTWLRGEMMKKRDLVVRQLSNIKNMRWVNCEGAFYAFIDLRPFIETTKKLPENTAMAFGEYLLDRYQVAMVPGEAFGTPGFIRFSYASSEEDLLAGIQLFSDALDSLK